MDSEYDIYEVGQAFVDAYVTDENIKDIRAKTKILYSNKADYSKNIFYSIKHYLEFSNKPQIFTRYEIPDVFANILHDYSVNSVSYILGILGDKKSIYEAIYQWFNLAYPENIVKPA